ncbi:MAG: protein translocase subunit SecF [Clostridia bacterium]
MFSPTGKRKIFFTISSILVVVSLLLIIFKGFNMGIDFTGGNLIQFDMGQKIPSEIESRLTEIASEKSGSNDISIQATGATEVIIKTPELENEVSDAIIEAVKAEYSLEQSAVMNNEKVSGTVSGRLIGDAIKAILIAVVLMLLYITIRFDFQSGTSAVLALAHDVIIMLGFQSLFGITVSTSFIAAILTILGYSINATIVIFDRIRENGKMMKKATPNEIADDAIRRSYTRAINSSITTLFTIGVLYIIGVASIKEFALPIIVGIVSGTYSSLFIAGPFWAWWKGLGTAKKPASAKK